MTDAEALQEICRRDAAVDRRDMIQRTFGVLLGLVDDVLPIGRQDAEPAKGHPAALRVPFGTRCGSRCGHPPPPDRPGHEHRGFDALPDVERLSLDQPECRSPAR